MIVIAAVSALFPSKKKEPRTFEVKGTTVVKDVSFTGNASSKTFSSLAFEASGTLASLLVKTGDKVEKGQKLALIDPDLAETDVAKARATRLSTEFEALLASEKATQDAAKLADANAKTLEKSRQAIIDAKKQLEKAEEVWRKTEDEYGDDTSTAKSAEASALAARTAYNAAQKARAEAIETTDRTQTAADNAAKIAEAQYLATIRASQNIAGASALVAAETYARLNLMKYILTAPFSGTITEQNIRTGEYAAAGKQVLKLEVVEDMEIVAKVSETDAAKLREDAPATITFDALPVGSQWQGKIEKVAPSAEFISGVPSYEIIVGISEGDLSQLKPGYSANITAHIEKKDNVLAVPRRAISVKGGKQFVNIYENGGAVEKEVSTGITGSDGMTEVTAGLSEGEKVLLEDISSEK